MKFEWKNRRHICIDLLFLDTSREAPLKNICGKLNKMLNRKIRHSAPVLTTKIPMKQLIVFFPPFYTNFGHEGSNKTTNQVVLLFTRIISYGLMRKMLVIILCGILGLIRKSENP